MARPSKEELLEHLFEDLDERPKIKREPIPELIQGDCLVPERIEYLSNGGMPLPSEKKHLKICDWCAFFAKHGIGQCLTWQRLIEISLGESLNREDLKHTAKCPACSYEVSQMCVQLESEAS